MKALIPAAGRGTRLYPHTHTKPKTMIRLAGEPILGHILRNLRPTPIEEVVVVVGGPMQDQVVEYAEHRSGHRFEFTFVEQEDPEGLGHSVYQAKDVVCGDPIVIALGDMLFRSGYGTFLDAHCKLGGVDGSIGVKQVEDPQHYGIVEVEEGEVVGLVEKPEEPPGNLAISGVYVIEDTRSLFRSLGYLIENGLRGTGDEFQLTDALDRMVANGSTLSTFEVEDWYDCGRPQTLLEANRILLERIETDGGAATDDAVVIEPVDVGADVDIEKSVVGPHVSIDDGVTITGSIVRDSIVGPRSTLRAVNLDGSLVGERTEVVGQMSHLNVGDNCMLNL